MTEFNRTHAAIFDELERQGLRCVDIAKLTIALLDAKANISCPEPNEPFQRCVACE